MHWPTCQQLPEHKLIDSSGEKMQLAFHHVIDMGNKRLPFVIFGANVLTL